MRVDMTVGDNGLLHRNFKDFLQLAVRCLWSNNIMNVVFELPDGVLETPVEELQNDLRDISYL